ncbi:MAG: SurA N-terminal domain-containing protein [Desulfuromusa sp.]|nr:SurA N-terminal domain-containing protein [Desulfuromusa sp.]
MERIFFTFLLFLLLTVSSVTAKTINKVAAVVNNDIISVFQLDKAVVAALAKNPNQNELTPEQFDQMKIQVLNKMISDQLLDQQIKKLFLTVAEEELNGAIEDVQLKNGLTPETLEQAIAAQGLTMPEYRKQVEKEILHYKLLSREVNYKVLVTNGEVRAYFNDHIDEYVAEPTIQFNRISYAIPVGNEEQRAELLKQVNITRDLLLNGEDFNEVLAGQGASATGGDMGQLVEADLAAPLQLAFIGLAAGGVSQPIELNGQIHLFQITSRTVAGGNMFDQVKDEIEEQLKREKTDIRFIEWQDELRNNAHIDIRI